MAELRDELRAWLAPPAASGELDLAAIGPEIEALSEPARTKEERRSHLLELLRRVQNQASGEVNTMVLQVPVANGLQRWDGAGGAALMDQEWVRCNGELPFQGQDVAALYWIQGGEDALVTGFYLYPYEDEWVHITASHVIAPAHVMSVNGAPHLDADARRILWRDERMALMGAPTAALAIGELAGGLSTALPRAVEELIMRMREQRSRPRPS